MFLRTSSIIVVVMCAGCRDLTPIEIERAAVRADGGRPTFDAGVAGGDAGSLSCEACLFGTDGCRALVDECFADTMCESIVLCMLDTGCYDGPANEEASRCGTPCVIGAGAMSTTDPGLLTAIDMALCADQECVACFPGE